MKFQEVLKKENAKIPGAKNRIYTGDQEKVLRNFHESCIQALKFPSGVAQCWEIQLKQ